jgi:nitroreductase
VLTVAKLRFESNQRENRHAFHDVGLAVANLTLQATALGMHVHQMGGFDRTKARELFGIPDDFEPVTVLALGYLTGPGILPEDLGERERASRARKPLDALVFAGGWGQASVLYTD